MVHSITTVTPDNVPALTYAGKPVVTSTVLASLYGTTDVRIRQNYSKNRARFEDGKHCYKVEGKELSGLRVALSDSQIPAKARAAILWTERGAARHAKMLETDQAWEVFEALEDHYFAQSVNPHSEHPVLPQSSTLIGTTIGTDGFRCLAAVLDGKVRHLPGSERRRVKNHIWQQVHKAFSVVSAEDIPAEQLDSARNFLAAYTVEGEWLPAPEARGAVFTDDDLSDLYVLLCHVYHLHRKWHASRIEQAMRLLESPVASRMCEHLSIANSFTTRLARTKGELMEAARKRQGANCGILPPIH